MEKRSLSTRHRFNYGRAVTHWSSRFGRAAGCFLSRARWGDFDKGGQTRSWARGDLEGGKGRPRRARKPGVRGVKGAGAPSIAEPDQAEQTYVVTITQGRTTARLLATCAASSSFREGKTGTRRR